MADNVFSMNIRDFFVSANAMKSLQSYQKSP